MTFYKIVDSEFQSTTLYRVYANSTDKLSGQILRSKISIKLLIHMGSKTLSLRDNQQKRKNNYLRSEFLGFYGVIDNFCKFHPIPFVAGRTF
jgi:hypothetical protein